MYPRQRWLFMVGCWFAIATAAVHLAGQFFGGLPPVTDAERQLDVLSKTVLFALPGGTFRSSSDLMTGFSLAFSWLLAGLGTVGLVVARRGAAVDALLFGVARTLAIFWLGMTVLSLTYFFIIPTMCLALSTICFALAAVRPPAPPRD